MSELSYKDDAARAYDDAFAHVSTYFLPFLLRAARLKPGERVLDAATGTGIAAEIALATVGPRGHVTAADVSQAMGDRARQRLAGSPNTSVVVGDGQALSFKDGTFGAVICSLGLMFFPDPARGLSEFHRVLRAGGRAAVSVNTTSVVLLSAYLREKGRNLATKEDLQLVLSQLRQTTKSREI
jgi:ubiquinone/menaquinone biosynthesis C-methylase UbiE